MSGPKKLAPIDWSALEKHLEEYRDWVAGEDFSDDENRDRKTYIFEAAIESAFGKGFWAWRNGLRR